jgi:hypothetical protein
MSTETAETNWLRDIPEFHALADVEQALINAPAGADDWELAERDTVLAGLTVFLASAFPQPLQEHILGLVELYCGRPIDDLQQTRAEAEAQETCSPDMEATEAPPAQTQQMYSMWVALMLSTGNKAIAHLEDGAIAIVERDMQATWFNIMTFSDLEMTMPDINEYHVGLYDVSTHLHRLGQQWKENVWLPLG